MVNLPAMPHFLSTLRFISASCQLLFCLGMRDYLSISTRARSEAYRLYFVFHDNASCSGCKNRIFDSKLSSEYVVSLARQPVSQNQGHRPCCTMEVSVLDGFVHGDRIRTDFVWKTCARD